MHVTAARGQRPPLAPSDLSVGSAASAYAHSEVVSAKLRVEVELGRMLGPFADLGVWAWSLKRAWQALYDSPSVWKVNTK